MATKEDYAYYCMQLMEGDTHMIGDLFKDLREDDLIDENDEFICDEDQLWLSQ